jgi:hypothetical protein
MRWSKNLSDHLPFLAAAFLASAMLGACASPKEAGDDDQPRRASAQRTGPAVIDLRLAPTEPTVHTVQLHVRDRESALPIIALNSDQRLSLSFDIVGGDPRPVSVYFYQADREWRRRLAPSEYLQSFQRDDILTYTPSRGTQVAYTHYRYSFPNQSIGFLVSGNYILRVTEQGDEDAVLFERPFFIVENDGRLELSVDNVMVGQRFARAQPVARLLPGNRRATNAFDYQTCFVRNAQWAGMRCADRPVLAEMPVLQFYLEPQAAFEADAGDFFLDLSLLRTGLRILSVDRVPRPYEVILQPDEARFPGTPQAPRLNGQTVVSSVVRDVAEPGTGAEYVNTRFSFVPPNERPFGGDVFIVGSFSNWQRTARQRMTWVSERVATKWMCFSSRGSTNTATREAGDRSTGSCARPFLVQTTFTWPSPTIRTSC